jgi:hypothetical protein
METDLPADQPADEVLAKVVRIEWSMAELEMRKVRAIAEAREAGSTWQEIGQALQATKQLAWERFATEIAMVELDRAVSELTDEEALALAREALTRVQPTDLETR